LVCDDVCSACSCPVGNLPTPFEFELNQRRSDEVAIKSESLEIRPTCASDVSDIICGENDEFVLGEGGELSDCSDSSSTSSGDGGVVEVNDTESENSSEYSDESHDDSGIIDLTRIDELQLYLSQAPAHISSIGGRSREYHRSQSKCDPGGTEEIEDIEEFEQGSNCHQRKYEFPELPHFRCVQWLQLHRGGPTIDFGAMIMDRGSVQRDMAKLSQKVPFHLVDGIVIDCILEHELTFCWACSGSGRTRGCPNKKEGPKRSKANKAKKRATQQ
jgi:hypothetical protein